MPTPDRTSLDQIVATARELLDSAGLTAVTMQAVAERVGVRPPSLYKRVDSRDALLRLVAEHAARQLGDAVVGSLRAPVDPDGSGTSGACRARDELGRLAGALRTFARAHPAAYQLIFAPPSGAVAADLAVLSGASAPVLDLAARLVGPEHTLDAARTVTAWAHGFITMELAGAFRLGGDVEQAWQFGVDHLADMLVDGGRRSG